MGLEGGSELEEEVNNIPPDITAGKFLIIEKISNINGKKPKPGQDQIIGRLINSSIQVGEQIQLSAGNTSLVVRIVQVDNKFKIFTESGSEYLFDPDKSVPLQH